MVITTKEYRFMKMPNGKVTHISAGGSPYLRITALKETVQGLEVTTNEHTFIIILPEDE